MPVALTRGRLAASAQEDEKLRRLVEEHGPKKWSLIAQKLRTKGSKQVNSADIGEPV